MKKVAILFLTFLFILGLNPTPAFAYFNPKKHLVIDGGYKKSYGDKEYSINDRTYLPLRDITRFLGGEIHYDDATRSVTINGTNVETGKPVIFVGKLHSNQITIDGVTRQLDTTDSKVRIEIIHDSISVPLRTISVIFGYSVAYEDLTQSILLDNPNAEKIRLNISPEPKYVKGMDKDDMLYTIFYNVELREPIYNGNTFASVDAIDHSKSGVLETFGKMFDRDKNIGDYRINSTIRRGETSKNLPPKIYESLGSESLEKVEEILSYFTKDYKEIAKTFRMAIIKNKIGDTEEYEYGIVKKSIYDENGKKAEINLPTKKITTSDGVTISFALNSYGNYYSIYIR